MSTKLQQWNGAMPTFNEGDDILEFVSDIYAIIFQTGEDDDKQLARLAASCIKGPALVWYSRLDESVRMSWRLLLPNLISHYYVRLVPVAAAAGSATTAIPDAVTTPAVIKVVDDSSGFTLGWLRDASNENTSYGSVFRFGASRWGSITEVAEEALVVEVPYLSQPGQLKMMTDPYAFLGVRYVPAPPSRPRQDEGSYGVPKVITKFLNTGMSNSLIESWQFAKCGPSGATPVHKKRSKALEHPASVASAAIWTVNEHGEEVRDLSMRWIENNGVLSTELAAYYTKGSPGRLIIHRTIDAKGSDSLQRVKLVYEPRVFALS